MPEGDGRFVRAGAANKAGRCRGGTIALCRGKAIKRIMWIHYLIVFGASVLVDTIPVIGLPAWVIMVFMKVKYDLEFWSVLGACVFGTTLGRYLQLLYLPKAAGMLLKRYKKEDLEFLGERLGKSTLRCWGFVLLHAVTPLPTTALFTAAALGKVPWYKVLVPFFAAKAVSDGLILATGAYAAANAERIMHSLVSFKALTGVLLSATLIALFFSVDWHLLLREGKLALRFKIWR
jgi:hypothetical protein